MKEIHVAFLPVFSRIGSFTVDGIKYINDNFKYEESAPASPNHEQSKSANTTSASGCQGHCTTAFEKVQEGDAL